MLTYKRCKTLAFFLLLTIIAALYYTASNTENSVAIYLDTQEAHNKLRYNQRTKQLSLSLKEKVNKEITKRSLLMSYHYNTNTSLINKPLTKLTDTIVMTKEVPNTKKKRDVVAQRAKFQQLRVERYCERYNLTSQKYKLPSWYKHSLYNILLLHNEAKVLYCAPPKTGSTHLKIAFLVSAGKLNTSLTKLKGPLNEIIRDTVTNNTIAQLDKDHKNKAVHTHYKYSMHRHPLERFSSSYRDKVKRYPLKGLEEWTPIYNWVKLETFQLVHPAEYKIWAENGGITEIAISFPDFVEYWLNTSARHDIHFEPINRICLPCSVRYDYYGNFKTFQQDAQVLLDKIHGNSSYLREGYYTNSRHDYTRKITKELYSQLNLDQKLRLLRKLSQELDFYYHLFPKEKNTHKQILGVNHELTLPYDDYD